MREPERVIIHPIDVFAERFDARVIPVSAQYDTDHGLMKKASSRYPGIVEPYNIYCGFGTIKPGDIIDLINVEPEGIMLAVTQEHWRDEARASCVLACFETLASRTYRTTKHRHVAVPALGCGLGGLSWEAHARAFRAALLKAHRAVTFYLSPPHAPGDEGPP